MCVSLDKMKKKKGNILDRILIFTLLTPVKELVYFKLIDKTEALERLIRYHLMFPHFYFYFLTLFLLKDRDFKLLRYLIYIQFTRTNARIYF